MAVLAEVLELATARITATEVLDLAGREPVRRRFRFGDEDLFRLEEWVDKACVRWGFDAAHRSSFQLEDIGSNTWQSGLDRILLGVTMADERQRLFEARCRWTTSTAPTSSWPVAWRSSSTGSALRSTSWPKSAPSTPGRTPWPGSRIR